MCIIMDMHAELKNMILAFRVSELQGLLGFAGRNKSGRKPELQARALDLIRTKPSHVVTKIRELYRSMQINPAPIAAPSNCSSTSSLYYNSPKASRLFTASSGYGGAAEKALQGRSPFVPYSETKMQGNVALSLPICPDVKFKKLPFYDMQCELIKPTTLRGDGPVRMQEGTFPFYLTPQQAQDIANSKEIYNISPYEQKVGYQVQVQLRFCLMDTNCEQADSFPPSICVKVNGKTVTLPQPIPSTRPGIEPKRPSKPVNVTNFVKLSPSQTNNVAVTWVTDGTGRNWVMCLYLVKKLTSSDLLNRLKAKSVRPADFTRGMIKEIVNKDDGDCMIAMTSLKVSVACPLGKCRMSLPARASTCSHLQCFDASLFFQMNEKKPTWSCPVCDKSILVENLSVDGYFLDVINSLSFEAPNDIEVLPDGSWRPMITIKKEKLDEPPAKRARSEVKLDNTICLDDEFVIDDDEIPSSSSLKPPTPQPENSTQKTVQVVDLTLSSSDEEEEAEEEDDDEEEDVIAPIRIRKRPIPRIVDESSSNSSSSSSSSSTSSSSSSGSSSSAQSEAQSAESVVHRRESIVVPNPRSAIASSPAVITLDSRSPSPEISHMHSRLGSNALGSSSGYNIGGSSNGNQPSSSSSHLYASGYPNNLAALSHYSMGYSSAHSSASSRRPGSSGLVVNPFSGSSSTDFAPGGIWDTNFQPGDFGSLDFGQLEDFYYEPPGGYGGSGSGVGGGGGGGGSSSTNSSGFNANW